MTVEELRKAACMTRSQFAAYFGVSYRTVQSWELYGKSSEGRKCPKHLLDLMEYKLRNENLIE